MDHDTVIRKALEPFVRAETKRESAAGAVYGALDEAGAVLDGTVATVEILEARIPVETVEVYGLVIRLDANGQAVSVHSPDGFQVTEYQKAST